MESDYSFCRVAWRRGTIMDLIERAFYCTAVCCMAILMGAMVALWVL